MVPMTSTRARLEQALRVAFDRIEPGADPMLRSSEHADLQANGALGLAKRLGRDPRELARQVAAAVELEGLCRVEVSGPGFLNVFVDDAFLANEVASLARDERLGVELASAPCTYVVDYSAPNVAKEMHVGHLRTTIIGDALCRMLSFRGHRVIRENHIGDWGTPFGMLIEHLLDIGEQEAIEELSVGDLDTFYRAARASFDASEEFRERSRRRVVLLQQGDEETRRLWSVLVAESLAYFDQVYARLGVLLTDDDVVGESAYNDDLPIVVSELAAAGLLVYSEGAACVYPPGFRGRDGAPLPLIVQKSDGGYNYAATDLAAIRDRVGRLGADHLLYVVGAPQSQHLEMCFAVARLAGWLPEDVEATHVAFGNVLGTDGKMLKTRSGKSVKLVELLDEAVARARLALGERGEAFSEQHREALARSVGIGAIKYADLSTERTRDYVFDWDRMLAFDGNTGPYLQYAHARIASLFRRAGLRAAPDAPVHLEAKEEHELALRLVGFSDALASALDAYAPHRLCQYLYDLASAFTAFYERCPVLRADEATKASRLVLAHLSARVLSQGLGLLGIDAPEQM
jgi:arginyl-tRNA synthetase